MPSSAIADEEVYDVHGVKAAFLYHFATFVLWPDSAPPGERFTIGIIGAPGVAAELRRYLPGRSLQGRPMQVREINSIKQLADEALLYVGPSRNDDLAHILEGVAGRPMLIVTDAPGALKMGSMINFRLVDRRVRFEISLAAAEQAGLELSSRLLSAALFVDTTSAVQKQPTQTLLAAAPGVGGTFSEAGRGLTSAPRDATFTVVLSNLPVPLARHPATTTRARAAGNVGPQA